MMRRGESNYAVRIAVYAWGDAWEMMILVRRRYIQNVMAGLLLLLFRGQMQEQAGLLGRATLLVGIACFRFPENHLPMTGVGQGV